MKTIQYIFFMCLSILLLSCSSDDNSSEVVVKTSNVLVTFDNRISANQDLSLGSSIFITQSGETITTNTLKYIVSNIQLVKDDGTVFSYPQEDSYFIINEQNQSSLQLNLTEIPVGNYTQIKFGIGVDPSKYPIESGALNFIPQAQEENMIWNWAAGYIFIKFEGTFIPQNSMQSDTFTIHVGSHGANLDNYKTVTLPLQNSVNVSTGNSANIQITSYIANILDATHQITLENTSDIQVDPVNAPKIATNLESVFNAQ